MARKYPSVDFTLSAKKETYNGKSKNVLTGSFLDENGNRILVTINEKRYKSTKTGKNFVYGRAVNLGFDQERPKRGQMS